MAHRQVRAFICWPDEVVDQTPWLADSASEIDVDAVMEAVFEVLNRRPGVADATITWEYRNVEERASGASEHSS